MTASSVELRAEDVRQLWSLACLMAEKQLESQAVLCLTSLCALDCSVRSDEEQEILVQANVLLAELCSVACNNSKRAENRDLWSRRIIQTEKCIHSVDAAVARGVPCSHENRLRLLKAKFLLEQKLEAEWSTKHKRIVEILAEGLQLCAEVENTVGSKFRKYFEVKLKACLVKIQAATVMTKNATDIERINSLTNSLKYLRATLPNFVDKRFLLWLVEATYQIATSSFHSGSTAEMRQVVQFGQEFFARMSQQEPVDAEFRLHHLIITGLYYLRVGMLTKVTPVLNQIKTLIGGGEGCSDQKKTRSLKASYLNTILDSMQVSVLALTDVKEACDLAMTSILSAQENLQTVAQFPAVRVLLIATLFDTLYVYCRLLGLQCRYIEMGVSIVQMTTLFETYKGDLERIILYRYYLARCHTLIALYATAIGNVKDACAHLNYVVDKVLPVPTVAEASYPDAYLAVWIDVLEVATYCCAVGSPESLSTGNDAPSPVQVKQIYPSQLLLEWVSRIFALDGLRHHIHQCCSDELRVKYDLALAKWMWATECPSNTNEGSTFASYARLPQYPTLEELRPKAFTLLHNALRCTNTYMPSSEATSEIMALFGPQLVAIGEVEQGENTLKNAICVALHCKNVLLQTRLLAAVFEHYMKKGLVQAQAAVANKYEKKFAVWKGRVAAALANEVTTAALVGWTVGSRSSTKTVETLG